MSNLNSVEELISIGEDFEAKRLEKVKNSSFGSYMEKMKSFNGIEFNEWIARSIFYLEEQKPSSLITNEIKEKFKNLQPSTSYEFYELLLGTLKALKK